MNPKVNLTFTRSAKRFVLDVFGKSVAKDNIIVEKSNPEQRVLTQAGEEISLKEFAGLRKGSVIFIKSNIVSLIEASECLP